MNGNIHNDAAQKLNAYLIEARESAGKGDEPKARGLLSVIRNIPFVDNICLSADVEVEMKEIRTLANRNAYEINLKEALEFAEKGEVASMQGRLAEARENASRAGMTLGLDEEFRFEQINKGGHLVGMRVRARDAFEYAKQGNVGGVESCFRALIESARIAGVPLSTDLNEQMKATVTSARKIAITNVLQEAERFMERGEYGKSSQYLSLAGWHANQAGISFDARQEQKYYTLRAELVRAGLYR